MANPTSQSSGLIATAGQCLYIGKNIVNGLLVTPGASATIYDNAAGTATGNVITQIVNTTGTVPIDILFNIGVRVDLGLTLVASGGNGAIVYFGGN